MTGFLRRNAWEMVGGKGGSGDSTSVRTVRMLVQINLTRDLLCLRSWRQKTNPADYNSPTRGLLPKGCAASSPYKKQMYPRGRNNPSVQNCCKQNCKCCRHGRNLNCDRVEFPSLRKLPFDAKWEAESFLLKKIIIRSHGIYP